LNAQPAEKNFPFPENKFLFCVRFEIRAPPPGKNRAFFPKVSRRRTRLFGNGTVWGSKCFNGEMPPRPQPQNPWKIGDEIEAGDEVERNFPAEQLWQSLCYFTGMTNTSFITRGCGIDPVAAKSGLLAHAEKFNWIDGVLVATFMASFLGLVCLLAQ
jgi:hypothetical protein